MNLKERKYLEELWYSSFERQEILTDEFVNNDKIFKYCIEINELIDEKWMSFLFKLGKKIQTTKRIQ